MDKALTTQRSGTAPQDVVVRLLKPDEIDVHWPMILQELRKIRHVWELWWTEESLYQQSMIGRVQVWTIGDEVSFHLVVFTHILGMPTGKILQLFLSFGSLYDSLDALNAAMEVFADENGCVAAEIVGRRGWEKFAKQRGFEFANVTLVRKLTKLRRH